VSQKFKVGFFLTLGILITSALLWAVYLYRTDIAVLDPQGIIAAKELTLMNWASLLMLIVVIPVFVLTAFIAWKYRAGNKQAAYTPEWDNNIFLEVIWWGLPFIIVLALSFLAYESSHELDPYKPLESDVEPITIQVVALQWKWLFIYPEQKIATVNFFQFPEKTPINFEVTADAPMNSFWIPQLGGQIYAMSGMQTKLHLIADKVGSYSGSSANISGAGFAGMTFTAKASSEKDFEEWVQSVKNSKKALNLDEYNELVKPTEYDPVTTYTLEKDDLFKWIVMKPMMPSMTPSVEP